MKKILFVTLGLMMAAGAFAQAMERPVPQPAFRLLDGYLSKRAMEAEYGAKTGPWVLMGTGLAAGAASATIWFASDSIADSAGVGRMNPQVKLGTALGLGIGSVVLTGIGLALRAAPPVYDERDKYSAIYHETDPTTQESMAAARLRSLAETTKDSRLVSGWVNLALGSAAFTFKVMENRDHGRYWSDGLLNGLGWGYGGVIGGITSLLVKSEEEKLFEEYQFVVARATKD